MFTRITYTFNPKDPYSTSYRCFHVEGIVYRDIGIQETCHML
jgi:hypothetical protein